MFAFSWLYSHLLAARKRILFKALYPLANNGLALFKVVRFHSKTGVIKHYKRIIKNVL